MVEHIRFFFFFCSHRADLAACQAILRIRINILHIHKTRYFERMEEKADPGLAAGDATLMMC